MIEISRVHDYEAILNQLNPTGKIRAYHVAAALQKRHTRKNTPDLFFEQVKTGSSYIGKPRILDAVAIRPSWASPCITGYEIKVDRGDFLHDDKWREYLPYTNEFCFVAPKGIIKESELPAEIGLMIFNPITKSVRTVRKAAWREIEKATAFDLLYFILLWRGENHHTRTNTERIEEYLAERISARQLGYNMKSKVLEELENANKKANDYESKFSRLERHSEELKQVKEMLLAADIGRNWDSVPERVKSLIDSRGETLDRGLKQQFQQIVAAAETIKKVIGI